VLFRSLATVLVTAAIGVAGFGIAAVWLHEGRTIRARSIASLGILMAFALSATAAGRLRIAWDLSENRRNSFSAADEAALAGIRQPLRITVFLSAEDPRLLDLDRNILAKLTRILPDVEIVHAAHSRSGLFEGSGDHYGEVWYELGGRKLMTRSTTEQIVLDNLYQLAQVPAPVRGESEFPGHPLPAIPRGAAWFYYAFWPLATGLAGWVHLRVWS
jgi:ABC-2 type transport system permease protein